MIKEDCDIRVCQSESGTALLTNLGLLKVVESTEKLALFNSTLGAENSAPNSVLQHPHDTGF